MRKLMNILTLSCKKASALIVKKEESPLSAIEKMQLIAHKSMCKACSAFEEQSEIIDKVIQRSLELTEHAHHTASQELKSKIISHLGG